MRLSLSGPLLQAVGEALEAAVSQQFASRLHAQDSTLWGSDAQPEAAIRLEWALDPSPGLTLIGEVEKLREEFASQGVTRFILCGMGGSSLAPEVISRGAQGALTILDSTHPDVLAPLLATDLTSTAVIVSSKSGGTVETDSQSRALEAAFIEQGIDPAERMMVVTDPGSPFSETAGAKGFRVFHGIAHIGGRFSALSPFGLVPGTLVGADTRQLLEDASVAWAQCVVDSADNPSLLLGAALAVQEDSKNKVLLQNFPDHPGLGDWIEQLVAESTGKDGTSLLPVVGSTLEHAPDVLKVGPIGSGSDIELEGTLGEHFMVWQFATAFASHLLEVNAFDQPNVESAKVAARSLLSGTVGSPLQGVSVPGGEIWQSTPAEQAATGWDELAQRVMHAVGATGYLAFCVFGGPDARARWTIAAVAAEATIQRPVTLGVGPRYLHSTGQLHKGGNPQGVFLVVVERPAQAVDIPGREFDFNTLVLAQARGDAAVLAATGQPVFVAWTDTPGDTESLIRAFSR